MSRSVAVLPVALVLLSQTACSRKAAILHLAEKTDNAILAAWRQGGMEKEAAGAQTSWALQRATTRESGEGAAQTLQTFLGRYQSQAKAEEIKADRLAEENEGLRAGKPYAKDAYEALGSMFRRDGKTPQQRAAENAPRIAENERRIEAHRKVAATCLKTVKQLERML